MECHVDDDFLLIWTDGHVIEVVRIGTHSELYGKGRSR
ncbi:type II toxin-antitoxin system YafQ family toxin [Prevotella sp.]|nr:type II toxin-antitoxin system YafQ family toxin [Prevotella sp.]MDN5554833.1 type II toxin-antitoxin system YafQ family toxin [Prevotella sp.]